MYSVLPYYCAKVISDIPSFIVTPCIFTALTYFSIGLSRDAATFFMFCLAGTMNTICGVSLGYMISCMFTNSETALMLAPMLAMPIILSGGFFMN